jgi:hypothetical protein
MIALQAGESVAVLLEGGYYEEAAYQQERQHREGMTACIEGVEFQNFRPAAWQQGWLDARELDEYAPLEWLRLDAEV